MDSKLSRSFSKVAVSTSFLMLSFLVNPAHAAYSGERDRAFRLNMTAAQRAVLRG